jgi:hypothetical protein
MWWITAANTTGVLLWGHPKARPRGIRSLPVGGALSGTASAVGSCGAVPDCCMEGALGLWGSNSHVGKGDTTWFSHVRELRPIVWSVPGYTSEGDLATPGCLQGPLAGISATPSATGHLLTVSLEFMHFLHASHYELRIHA